MKYLIIAVVAVSIGLIAGFYAGFEKRGEGVSALSGVCLQKQDAAALMNAQHMRPLLMSASSAGHITIWSEAGGGRWILTEESESEACIVVSGESLAPVVGGW